MCVISHSSGIHDIAGCVHIPYRRKHRHRKPTTVIVRVTEEGVPGTSTPYKGRNAPRACRGIPQDRARVRCRHLDVHASGRVAYDSDRVRSSDSEPRSRRYLATPAATVPGAVSQTAIEAAKAIVKGQWIRRNLGARLCCYRCTCASCHSPTDDSSSPVSKRLSVLDVCLGEE